MRTELRQRRTVFGPVASRRLGLSLGVDLVPAKTCNLNCLYCECGRTTRLVAEPGPYLPAEAILAEVQETLAEQAQRLDYVTLSGAGEPTLNSHLSEIIKGLRSLTRTRLAVITNSTLLHRPEVTQALAQVEVVMPSLDTAIPATFRRLNRPHPAVTLEQVLTGLKLLRRKARGEIWLEILLVAGLNDTAVEIEALAHAVGDLGPERIQLNTVDRPPAEAGVEAVSHERLVELARTFGPRAEVIARPSTFFRPAQGGDLSSQVLELIDRRPCTREDLIAALGRPEAELASLLESLAAGGRIRPEKQGGLIFWRGLMKKG